MWDLPTQIVFLAGLAAIAAAVGSAIYIALQNPSMGKRVFLLTMAVVAALVVVLAAADLIVQASTSGRPSAHHSGGTTVAPTTTSTAPSPSAAPPTATPSPQPTASPTPTSTSTSTPTPTPVPNYQETAGPAGGPTFADYANESGPYTRVPAYDTIVVSCRLTGMATQDGNPWWYLIASSPWSNNYYSPADDYYNNGQTSGSLQGGPWVDISVPVC